MAIKQFWAQLFVVVAVQQAKESQSHFFFIYLKRKAIARASCFWSDLLLVVAAAWISL